MPVLLLALLGGLVLNLMPCVLPVLTLKILHLLRLRETAEASADDATFLRAVRRGFVVSALGIYTAFLSLGLVVALGATLARSVGWGAQFQSPTFVVALALALTLFTAWVWGWWRVPISFGALGGGKAGGNTEETGGFLSNFSAGLVATLLATPCSAPFLGTAVGFALTLNPADTLLIFFALATGFAAPWWLFAFAPQLARLLPRPGAWMERLEQLLGFGLLLTALWLVTLLGGLVALGVGGLLALLLFVLRFLSKTDDKARALAGVGVGLAVMVLLAPHLPQLFSLQNSQEASQKAAEPAPAKLPDSWQAFSPRAVELGTTGGKVSLVVFTADWCVTCKVNESLVLGATTVEAQLSTAGVVALLGDWTEPDTEISAWLARHGRYGIPFTAVYGPGVPEGILLPELLTKGAVLQALEEAKGG